MGAVLLAALYVATSLSLGWLVRALGRRPSLPAVAVLTLLPLAFTAEGFLPGRALAPTNALLRVAPWLDPGLAVKADEVPSRVNPFLFDPLSQMLPWQRAGRDHLLLNPAQGAGAALLANGQSALLYPTQVAARALPPVRGATYAQSARLAVAAWGMYLLLSSLALSEVAALVGAAVFAGSGFLELWRLHPQSLVAATLPFILWAAIRLARRPGPRPALALAAAGAAGVYAGHPETLFHGVLLAAAIAAAVLAGRLRRPLLARRRAARAAGWAAAAAALAFLLSGPLLLPFTETLHASEEWQRRRAGLLDWVEVPAPKAILRLAGAVSPWAFGDPISPDDRAPDNTAELAGGAVGGAALLLVPAAFALRRRRRFWTLWAVLGLLGLLVSVHWPGLSRPFSALPLLHETLLKRLSLWWALAAPALAAGGVEALRRRRGWRLLAAGGVGVGASLAAVAFALPASRALPGVPLEALAAVVAGVAGRWLARPWAVAVLGLSLLLPRVLVFADWVPVVSSYTYYPETPAIRAVVERAAGYRVAGMAAALLPQSAAFFGLEEVRAYDPMTFAPYARFLESVGDARRHPSQMLTDPLAPGLSFLGVRFLFDHPSMGRRPGLALAYYGPDAVVYENPHPLPRVFLPRRVEVVEGVPAALERVGEVTDFADLALLSGVGAAPGVYPNDKAALGSVTVEVGRITAAVHASGLALVATSQPAIPGWRLWRNGREERAPVRVNGAFLGAVVPAGESRLEWLYAPRSWDVGRSLFGLGLVLAVLAFLGSRRRRTAAG